MTTAVEARPTMVIPGSKRSSPWDVVLVVMACGFGVLGLRPLADPDVWWHLRTGELIVHSGFVRSDPWSFASSKAWVLHEWGSQVLMYLSYLIGGYRGVIALHAAGMLVLAALLLRSIRRQTSARATAALGFLALVGLMPGSGERPQLVSWCLLAAVLPPLQRFVQERRTPWWLIPVIWVWANLHGLWSAALVLYGFLVLGLLIELGWSSWRTLRPFVAVGVLSLLVAAATPNGPALLLMPLQVRAYAGFVSEWQPPPLLSPFFGAAYALMGVLVITYARRRDVVPATELALAVGAVVIGLAYIRTVPVMIIAITPLAANGLRLVWPRLAPTSGARDTANAVIAVATAVVFAVTGVVWLSQVPKVARQAPWKASAELDSLPGHARVLNEYVVGGWLLWTARDVSPAIDGRTEIYDPDYVAAAMGAPGMAHGWQKFVRRGRFDAALLGRDAPLIFGLEAQGWTIAERDHRLVIMLPPDARKM